MSLIFAINCFNNGKVNCTIHQNCLLWNSRQIRIFKDKGQAECSELSFQQGKLTEIALQVLSVAEILGMKTHLIQTRELYQITGHYKHPNKQHVIEQYVMFSCLHGGVVHRHTLLFSILWMLVKTHLEHVFRLLRTPVRTWMLFISWLILCTTRPNCVAAWTCHPGAAQSLDLQ